MSSEKNRITKADLKKNYKNLNVEFDLWKGESDAQPYIPDMIDDFVARGFAHESQGALVVDVARPDDAALPIQDHAENGPKDLPALWACQCGYFEKESL